MKNLIILDQDFRVVTLNKATEGYGWVAVIQSAIPLVYENKEFTEFDITFNAPTDFNTTEINILDGDNPSYYIDLFSNEASIPLLFDDDERKFKLYFSMLIQEFMTINKFPLVNLSDIENFYIQLVAFDSIIHKEILIDTNKRIDNYIATMK